MVTIVEVNHDSKNAKVILSDGSTLEGVRYVETVSEQADITRVRLEVYVLPRKKENTFKIMNRYTSEVVLLTKAEYDRFFDNRKPEDWVYV
jgi:hypothetical protein